MRIDSAEALCAAQSPNKWEKEEDEGAQETRPNHFFPSCFFRFHFHFGLQKLKRQQNEKKKKRFLHDSTLASLGLFIFVL